MGTFNDTRDNFSKTRSMTKPDWNTPERTRELVFEDGKRPYEKFTYYDKDGLIIDQILGFWAPTKSDFWKEDGITPTDTWSEK